MNDTKKSGRRGRPRGFNPDEGVALAQRLFHARGYDAVGVAELTSALGINPPSFYAAFGSKADLFSLALDRYAIHSAVPLDDLLSPEQPVAAGLARVLEEAARRYAADPATAGCLVLESVGCHDETARAAAQVFHRAALERLRAFIANRHPDKAEQVTDFIGAVMAGLSARARDGLELDRLLAAARLGAAAIAEELST
ncbi:TetR/AcrR family transcriptional regulator [Rhizobium sp. FKL33]|uniref:TetR/AcrR family transcriptional regulator n=1 Tax=Rhizobium sp. FKL33 TaxID=2562307 RepID=UPI0010BF92EF|nr:TetR/AcrR family transcriptional regulator [Rhizobium sp. FKL33]